MNRHSTDFLLQKALFKSQTRAECGMSQTHGCWRVVCGGVLQDSMLLWTTSWVLRSFIAAVVLVELVFLGYSCVFNLPVLWVGGGGEQWSRRLSFSKVLPFLQSGTWCVLVKRGAVSDGVEWVS